MPNYDFQCSECKNVFECELPIGSKEFPSCPNCKNANVEKLIAAPAVIFKGKGFYRTDSVQSAPMQKSAPTEKEPKAEAEKKIVKNSENDQQKPNSCS